MNSDLVIRVKYEGSVYDLDVLNDVSLRLDMSTVEVEKLGRIFGIGSQTFTLPGTKNNNKFFKNAYEVGADNPPGMYNSIDGWVIQNGETLLYGQFQLIEVVTDEDGFVNYNVQISDKVIQFKEALQGKFIKDGDWSAYTHTLTSSSIVDSWSGNLLSGSIFYPLAEYGRPEDEQDSSPYPYLGFYSGSIGDVLRPVQVEQFLPAVRVRDALSVIFDQVGFRYTGSFMEKPDVYNLYMLTKANDDFGPVIPSASATFTGYGSSTNELVFLNTTRSKVEVSVEVSDPQNAFNTSSYEYTAQANGSHEFNGSITFFNPVTTSDVVNIKLELRAGSYPSATSILSTSEIDLTFSSGTGPFTLSVAGTTNMTPSVDNAWLEISYTQVSGGGTPLSLVLLGNTGRQFRCIQAPITYKGATVNMADQFSAELKSEDVIKALITQFNLVMVPVPYDQSSIQIETFDDWIRSGGQKDWSDKYDASKRISIQHTINDLPKKVILTQAEDNDRLSRITKEQEPYRQYGSLELFATSNNTVGEDKLETVFAPIILGGVYDASNLASSSFDIDTNSTTVFPHLYKYENDKILPYAFKPRLGYRVNNNLPSGSFIYIGDPAGGSPYSGSIISGSYGTLSNLSKLPAVPGDTADLHFNNTYDDFGSTSLNFNLGETAFTSYWKTYYDSLYWDDSKKVTMDVQFDPYEYKNIKLNDKILVKNQYYRINKIKGFNLSKRDVVTVELVRLYPAYFIPTYIPGVFPSPLPSPSGGTPTPSPSSVTPTPSPSNVTPTPSPTITVSVTPTPSSGSSPTPSPSISVSPTPSITPSVSSGFIETLQISSGSVNPNGCGNTLTGSVYSSVPLGSWTEYGQRVYTDPALTNTFDGGNRYHRVSDGTFDSVWSISATGLVSEQGPDCTGIFQFYGNTGYLTEGNECFGLTTVERYSGDFTNVNDIQIGDRIYANAALTYELSDGWYYGIANSQSVEPEVAFQYSLIAGVTQLGDCNAGIPVSMSSYAFNATDACQDTTWEFTAYVPQGSDPFNMPSGSRFYSNPQLTSGFGLNNLFYGAYTSSLNTPYVWYQLQGSDPLNGYVIGSASCGFPGAYSASRDEGSTIGGEGCFNTPTGQIYMREPLATIVSNGSGQFYENSFASVVFPGNSGRYSLHQSASGVYPEARAIFTINSSGVGTLYQNCGLNLYSFFGTSGQSLSSDPCNAPLLQTMYTDEFDDVALMVTGSRIYTNAQLSNELADNFLYAISNISASDGRAAGTEARSFKYLLLTGVSDIYGSCAPTASAWYGTSPTIEANACEFTTPNNYYTSGSYDVFSLLGQKLYSDAGATTEITANNQWIGLGYNPSPATADVRVYYVSGSGITQLISCGEPVPGTSPTPTISVTPSVTPSITPTPSQTPAVYDLYATSGQSIEGVVCGATTGANIFYTTQASRGLNIDIGDIMYADPARTIPFNGGPGLGLYYGVGLPGVAGAPEVEVRINSSGVVGSKTICVIAPSPTPSPSAATLVPLYRDTTSYLNSLEACDSGSASFLIYGSAPIQDIQFGDFIYTNQSYTPFDGNNEYWYVEEENAPFRFRVLRIADNGEVLFVTNCGVPDPTPSVTPTVTPSITPPTSATPSISVTVSVTPTQTPPPSPSPSSIPSQSYIPYGMVTDGLVHFYNAFDSRNSDSIWYDSLNYGTANQITGSIVAGERITNSTVSNMTNASYYTNFTGSQTSPTLQTAPAPVDFGKPWPITVNANSGSAYTIQTLVATGTSPSGIYHGIWQVGDGDQRGRQLNYQYYNVFPFTNPRNLITSERIPGGPEFGLPDPYNEDWTNSQRLTAGKFELLTMRVGSGSAYPPRVFNLFATLDTGSTAQFTNIYGTALDAPVTVPADDLNVLGKAYFSETGYPDGHYLYPSNAKFVYHAIYNKTLSDAEIQQNYLSFISSSYIP